MTRVDFDTPDLAKLVEGLSQDAFDALPFGAIRVDADDQVLRYNQTERRLSGSGARDRLGRGFFTQVAPCMDNDAFRGRAAQARRAGTLDIEFTHIGDFSDRDRELTVRLQSAPENGMWIFIRRED